MVVSPMLVSMATPMLPMSPSPMVSSPLSSRLKSPPPTSQSPLLLEDTRPRLETMVSSWELSMRFPDLSLPLLLTCRRTLMEELCLSEPALSSPTLLSRGRLKLTLLFCMELTDMDLDMPDTMDLDIPDTTDTLLMEDMLTTVK